MLRRLILEEDGQSLVEYGLILGLVSVMLVAGLTSIRSGAMNVFNEVAARLQDIAKGAPKAR